MSYFVGIVYFIDFILIEIIVFFLYLLIYFIFCNYFNIVIFMIINNVFILEEVKFKVV